MVSDLTREVGQDGERWALKKTKVVVATKEPKEPNSSCCSLSSQKYHTKVMVKKVITTQWSTIESNRAYCARSVFTHLELWRKLYDFSLRYYTTSQCVLILWSIDICADLQRLTAFKGGTVRPPFWGLGGMGNRRWAHSITHPSAPILTHRASRTVFLSYLTGSKRYANLCVFDIPQISRPKSQHFISLACLKGFYERFSEHRTF